MKNLATEILPGTNTDDDDAAVSHCVYILIHLYNCKRCSSKYYRMKSISSIFTMDVIILPAKVFSTQTHNKTELQSRKFGQKKEEEKKITTFK